MRYLELADLQAIAAFALERPLEVRDWGLLQSALARPATSVFGEDAYPTVWDKAAALLHSLARNHPLVDGDKRLAWLATYVFLAKNGAQVDPDDDDAYAFVIAVAAGEIDDVAEITTVLASRQVEA